MYLIPRISYHKYLSNWLIYEHTEPHGWPIQQGRCYIFCSAFALYFIEIGPLLFLQNDIILSNDQIWYINLYYLFRRYIYISKNIYITYKNIFCICCYLCKSINNSFVKIILFHIASYTTVLHSHRSNICCPRDCVLSEHYRAQSR